MGSWQGETPSNDVALRIGCVYANRYVRRPPTAKRTGIRAEEIQGEK